MGEAGAGANDIDRGFLHRVHELAEQARAAGESAVGTVVVQRGEIIAEGVEAMRARPDPAGHAELLAIKYACARLSTTDLSDCTLYTNVEPCFMCGYAIRATGIRRVVMQRDCGEIGSVKSKYPFLPDGDFERWGPPPEIVWAD